MGVDFSKNLSASLLTTYQMKLIYAGSISLDSTFKKAEVTALLALLIFPFRLFTLLILSAPSLNFLF
jgi:hypothetical protein